MKKNMRYALILLSICAVSAFLLAFTNSITAPVIEEMDHQSRLKALEAVSGGLEIGEQESVEEQRFVTYRIPLSEEGEHTGWILGLKGASSRFRHRRRCSLPLMPKRSAAQASPSPPSPRRSKQAATT